MKPVTRGLLVLSCAVALAAAVTVGDDFDDGVVDPARWGADFPSGNGTLHETGQHLEYTVASPTGDDNVSRTWVAGGGPYDAAWSVQVEVYDASSPAADDEVSSIGIDVFSSRHVDDEFFAELYASNLGLPPLRRGFHAELLDDGVVVGTPSDTGSLDVTSGAVRIAFDPATKVLAASYDVDPSNGYTWVPFASWGVAGTGGADGNADFGMDASDRFVIAVYGYAAHMVVASGAMYADDFATTGLVPFATPTTTTVTTTTSTTTTTQAPPLCAAAPRTDCRTSRAGGLTIAVKARHAADALAWTWKRGAATTTADLGDPARTTGWGVCLYDADGLRSTLAIPAGGTCAGKPCWAARGAGYRLRARTGGPRGIRALVLKPGPAGKAAVVLRAKGASLAPPAPPLPLPVQIQLVRDDGGPCWGATFGTAVRNATGRFVAHAE